MLYMLYMLACKLYYWNIDCYSIYDSPKLNLGNVINIYSHIFVIIYMTYRSSILLT